MSASVIDASARRLRTETADDVGRFGQMILRGGELNGRHFLQPRSVLTMTSTQDRALTHSTPGKPEAGFGYGWATTREWPGDPSHGPIAPCGHLGAYKTHLWIDSTAGLVLVFMVQHAGPLPLRAGPEMLTTFHDAAYRLSGRLPVASHKD